MRELPSLDSPTSEIVCELLLSPDFSGKIEVSKSSYTLIMQLYYSCSTSTYTYSCLSKYSVQL
jgi:hypothetical protein